ncbi:MAG: outer membrane protein assembly factor BamD [Proteobacteria bacterium]|nr:outer membrane protein assembly factor BamD [Pseudomonadota bacterium]MCH9758296.1 outer membrane protein assembly factor BamD [Pseudomonadota bacterium]
MKRYCILSLLFALSLLAGCATAPETVPTALELYEEAQELHNTARYGDADAKFEELKSTYPTSPQAQQAILDQIYGYLKRREYALAVSTADEFINLYPDHPQTPYALYMKGVVYFREDRGILDKLGKQDPTSRDPQLMRLSYQAFKELLNSYPESKYTPDVVARLRYLINSLAKSEMHIANYYYQQGAYVAAITRVKTILEIYSDSNSTEAALVLLLNSYKRIGAIDAADDTLRLIKVNFPDNAEITGEISSTDSFIPSLW